jgi:hypothetical protein
MVPHWWGEVAKSDIETTTLHRRIGKDSFARGRARYLGGPVAVTPAPGHDNLFL